MSFLQDRPNQTASAVQTVPGPDTGLDVERYATEGATGIRVLVDPSDAAVDIVLVHGFTGNRETTWTHCNGVFWPATLLSEDMPRARIMTFGYDADIVRFWTTESSSRLSNRGMSLACDLLDQRDEGSRRPIIFVAHGLGGLVCKEALKLSDKRQSLRSILNNTLGIIFLGTPHGASQLAGWGSTAAKYATVFRGINPQMLENLQPGSSDLQKTEEAFQHMLQRENMKIRIYCFCEALEMNYTVGKLVERESAVLPAYDNANINSTHRDMTKFTGRADSGYGQVRGVLERWIKEYENGDCLHVDSPAAGKSINNGSTHERMSNSGTIFYGPISGRNVVPGFQNTNGTVNFNFPG